ncbi:MAG: cobalt ECF transporter T component CbiQ, partial [Anaerovoracaceae bacterium]
MIMIDKLAYSSEIRQMNTGIKAALALGPLLICVAVRTGTVALIVLLAMSFLTVRYSNVSLLKYLKLMTGPLVFLLLSTIAIACDFTREGILVTGHSLMTAALLVLVSLASVSCLYFLTLTTPVLDLIGLLKSLHCPWLVVELMLLIYRFIFILLEIAAGITVAQNCRLGNKDLKTSISSMGKMLAQLLIIAFYKSEQMFNAMEARCYDGKLEVVFTTSPAK